MSKTAQVGVDPVHAADARSAGSCTRAPASGVPSLANRVIITNTLFAPIARSIAPPTAGIASGAPVCQLARSPAAETWKAPSTQTSRWPPRIIANESAWWKYAAPGSSVTGFLPGVGQVGVLLARLRRGAHVEHAVLGVQHHPRSGLEVVGDHRGLADAEVDVGARRDVAGDQRGHLVLAQWLGERHLVTAHLDDTVDVDARRHDDLGVEPPSVDDLAHLGDHRASRRWPSPARSCGRSCGRRGCPSGRRGGRRSARRRRGSGTPARRCGRRSRGSPCPRRAACRRRSGRRTPRSRRPAARIRSARLPCGTSSSSIRPSR